MIFSRRIYERFCHHLRVMYAKVVEPDKSLEA